MWEGGLERAVNGPQARVALEGKGPQRGPQRRLGRRLEEVAKAVGGGYCQLQMPLKPALGVRETVAGRRLGALEEGGGGNLPCPSNASLRTGRPDSNWRCVDAPLCARCSTALQHRITKTPVPGPLPLGRARALRGPMDSEKPPQMWHDGRDLLTIPFDWAH